LMIELGGFCCSAPDRAAAEGALEEYIERAGSLDSSLVLNEPGSRALRHRECQRIWWNTASRPEHARLKGRAQRYGLISVWPGFKSLPQTGDIVIRAQFLHGGNIHRKLGAPVRRTGTRWSRDAQEIEHRRSNGRMIMIIIHAFDKFLRRRMNVMGPMNIGLKANQQVTRRVARNLL